jgi:hypothetical protein
MLIVLDLLLLLLLFVYYEEEMTNDARVRRWQICTSNMLLFSTYFQRGFTSEFLLIFEKYPPNLIVKEENISLFDFETENLIKNRMRWLLLE